MNSHHTFNNQIMEWISVKDRLPEKNGRYLVYMNRRIFIEKWGTNGVYIGDPPFQESIEIFYYWVTKMTIGHVVPSWDARSWVGDLTQYITHWMPLPEPPKP